MQTFYSVCVGGGRAGDFAASGEGCLWVGGFEGGLYIRFSKYKIKFFEKNKEKKNPL